MTFHRTSVLVVAIVVGCSDVSAAAAAEQKVVAYRGASIFDVTDASFRPDMVIVTRAQRVVAIHPDKDFKVPEDADIVDIRGKYLMPGLINSHVHLATLANPSAAKSYLRRELYSGVTAVRDMAGDVRLLSELKREAEFDEIPSPEIYYAAAMAGPAFFKDPRTHDAARGRTAGEVPWMQAITAQQIDYRHCRGTRYGSDSRKDLCRFVGPARQCNYCGGAPPKNAGVGSCGSISGPPEPGCGCWCRRDEPFLSARLRNIRPDAIGVGSSASSG